MTVHIAMVSLSGLLGDVVADAFAGDPGVEVRELPPGIGVAQILAQPTDVLIVGIDDPDRIGVCGDALVEQPGLVLLGVSLDARQGWIYELRPTPRPLSGLSSASLREAVTEALGSAAT